MARPPQFFFAMMMAAKVGLTGIGDICFESTTAKPSPTLPAQYGLTSSNVPETCP